ncbi:hypothetical protein [Streptomyces sp. NPDC049915]|uniref:hypothetical protein n=1 Tax=Streptomyces sp. NPDC049915 TaxID=3155510 RepID=UPI00343AD7D6
MTAHARVLYAWKLRGKARAQYTSRSQFDGFHRELLASQDDIERALTLHPDDPTPLVAEIWRALGLGSPHSDMHAQITARAPHHLDARHAWFENPRAGPCTTVAPVAVGS